MKRQPIETAPKDKKYYEDFAKQQAETTDDRMFYRVWLPDKQDWSEWRE